MLQLWYQALSSPYGIELVCSNADSARAVLYRDRLAAQDSDLESITITVSPFDPNKLWLLKKEPKT